MRNCSRNAKIERVPGGDPFKLYSVKSLRTGSVTPRATGAAALQPATPAGPIVAAADLQPIAAGVAAAPLEQMRYKQEFGLRNILSSREYNKQALLDKYDAGGKWTTPEFHAVKRMLGTWLLYNCREPHYIHRDMELKPFCSEFLDTFPRQELEYTMQDLVNDAFTGMFETYIRHKKTSTPGIKRRKYNSNGGGTEINGPVLDPSSQDYKLGRLNTIKLRRMAPTPENDAAILKLFDESRAYRQDLIMAQKLEEPVLDFMPRYKDCPKLVTRDFNKYMEGKGEDVTAAQFVQSWDSDFVDAILELALEKKTNSMVQSIEIPAVRAVVASKNVENIPLGERSEAAFMILPFLAPACGKLKCQKKTLDKLMVTYTDMGIDDIKQDILERELGGAPFLVKVVGGAGATEEFFIGLDGDLIRTGGGDATQALMLLYCSFYVFWVRYPKELMGFYRILDHVMGVTKVGLQPTVSMRQFLARLSRKNSDTPPRAVMQAGASSTPVTTAPRPITQAGASSTTAPRPMTQAGARSTPVITTAPRPMTQAGASSTPVTTSPRPITQAGASSTTAPRPMTQAGARSTPVITTAPRPMTQAGASSTPVTTAPRPMTQSGARFTPVTATALRPMIQAGARFTPVPTTAPRLMTQAGASSTPVTTTALRPVTQAGVRSTLPTTKPKSISGARAKCVASRRPRPVTPKNIFGDSSDEDIPIPPTPQRRRQRASQLLNAHGKATRLYLHSDESHGPSESDESVEDEDEDEESQEFLNSQFFSTNPAC